jgi:pyridinium-3,5-biscarboxylic acid mononucleotide sulfurtransferase
VAPSVTLVPVNVSIGRRPDAAAALDRLDEVLRSIPSRIVACSGGIDSLVLATVAHRSDPTATIVAHTVTPAVPGEGTARVVDYAERAGWELRIVRSREFDDERYLSNPTDRCYYCKSNLYDAIAELRDAAGASAGSDVALLSGANVDDLGEYRPGLTAAAERAVRHPYVEAGITKAEIRAMARELGVADADLPASPCLASRLYTGTRVTASRLRAIEAGEALVRAVTGVEVVRCRVRDRSVLIEVGPADRAMIDDAVIARVAATMSAIEPTITDVRLDERDYEPGRAFIGSDTTLRSEAT